nr:hypothetical protein [Tanacetum cinerariifolium]
MANQEQKPSQQEQPFVAAKQVGFNLEDIILNINNEVALLYPEHNNKYHLKCVSDFISKCFYRKPFTKSPNMYKEYLAEFCYSAKALENSKVFFLTPIGVRSWFETIRYGEVVPAKGTLKKSLLPPTWSLANRIHIDYASIFWEDIIIKLNKKHKEKALKPNQPKEPPFTDHMLAICYVDTPVVFKAPKTSSKAKSIYQGTKAGAKSRHKKLLTSSKQPSVSSREATKGGSSKAPTSSKNGHSKKRKESNSTMDSNPSQPPVSTPVDTKMHKEDQQATGGPTSLEVTSKVRSNPQLSSVVSIAEADPRKSAPSDFVPQQQ